jgi:peptide/nickel transport system ATP-binding protein
MSALLEIEDLRVEFPGVIAVNGLSFALAEDEVLAIVGESGCGKTVTGLSILGLEPRGARVTGHVRLRGEDLRMTDAKRLRDIRGREIAMVFQEPMTSLNPSFTVGYQVAEVLRRHQGMTRGQARDRVRELFELVRMPSPERHLREYPHQLSGGMRQRVMIAMAVACDPAVLIADEPTTALDPTIQVQILDLLRELRARLSLSVVLITHNLGVVTDLADRVLVMYAGHKVEESAVGEVFTAPLHPYATGLLNALPRPGASRATHRLTAIGGQVPLLSTDPASCVFSDRCPLVTDACLREQPPLLEVRPGHLAACVRAGERVTKAVHYE